MIVLLVVVTLALVVVAVLSVLALEGGRALEHRTRGPAAPAAEATSPATSAMHRTTSSLRLVLLRSLTVGAALGFPALFLASGPHGLLSAHLQALVIAAHGALGVAVASWLERRATVVASRQSGTAPLAGVVATVLVALGAVQSVYAVRGLSGGTPPRGSRRSTPPSTPRCARRRPRSPWPRRR